jgi:hypothetical protein
MTLPDSNRTDSPGAESAKQPPNLLTLRGPPGHSHFLKVRATSADTAALRGGLAALR